MKDNSDSSQDVAVQVVRSGWILNVFSAWSPWDFLTPQMWHVRERGINIITILAPGRIEWPLMEMGKLQVEKTWGQWSNYEFNFELSLRCLLDTLVDMESK